HPVALRIALTFADHLVKLPAFTAPPRRAPRNESCLKSVHPQHHASLRLTLVILGLGLCGLLVLPFLAGHLPGTGHFLTWHLTLETLSIVISGLIFRSEEHTSELQS